MNPHTVIIEADLSRADVVHLVELCKGKRVVEFGCGGSTVLLAQVAAQLTSYDSSADWVKLARERLKKEGAVCPTKIEFLKDASKPPQTAPRADVYFIDGLRKFRPGWTRAVIDRGLASVIAMHDSRRPNLDVEFLLQCPTILKLQRLDVHPNNSNLLVIHTRERPVAWENWNLTEPFNRAKHLHRQGK